jgi:N-methylhydantoinase A
MGGLYGDIVTEFTVSRRTHTGQFDHAGVDEALNSLDQQMGEFFARMNIAPEAQVRDYVVEARYPYQVWELDVPLPARQLDDVAALEQAFHATHERVFAVSEPGQRVECLTWKGRASVALPKPAAPRAATNGAGPRPVRSRPAWWGADEPRDTPVLEGEHLPAGSGVRGPAIVELPTTTVVVYPDWTLAVNEHGDFVMSREATAGDFAEEGQ